MTFKDRLKIYNNKSLLQQETKLVSLPCSDSLVYFISNHCMTYDPRTEDKVLPFELFPKQIQFIEWLWGSYKNKNNGVVDKCRDVGATWCYCAFIVWLLLFRHNASVGVHTYKADECDRKGDVSTIFGKLRFVLHYLPGEWKGNIIDNFMYLKNKTTGTDIAGSSGDNAGRGGRRTIYLKDESAFYQHDELIEAAVSETSDCIIEVSTHSGTQSLFYRKTTTYDNKFEFNWWDIPNHTQEWYDAKKKKAEKEGTVHIFKREIERNAAGSQEGSIINPEWVECALTEIEPSGKVIAGLDVADEGGDTNCIVIMKGDRLIYMEEWADGDTTETADKAFNIATKHEVEELRYDNIGVGAGVKARFKEISKNTNTSMKFIGWSASGAVVRPSSKDYSDKRNSDMFENAKAQAYWRLREQFIQVYRKFNNKDHDNTKAICIKCDNPLLIKLKNEISQPKMRLSSAGKIIIDKKPKGTKSPNILEALVIARAEASEKKIIVRSF